MVNKNIYINLLGQFEKIFNHNRQGSYRTKYRYAEAFKRFLAYLAEEFRLERIANISPKHVCGYVHLLQEKGRSPAYIKTELSAIRFFHNQIPNARHKLPDNSDLSLQRRRFGQTDRTWSQREFNLFVAKAMELNGFMKPGQRADAIHLKQALTAGTYKNAILRYSCYALSNEAPMNGADTKFTLEVVQ